MFEQFVLYGKTISFLAIQAQVSPRTLINFIHSQLDKAPPDLKIPPPSRDPNEWFLILDAIWFRKRFCLMLYRYHNWPFILKATCMYREDSRYIIKDLQWLRDHGYQAAACVSDGGTGIRKALEEVFPVTPHQLCLAHVHREANRGLGRHPKDFRTQRLRQLVDHLWLIENPEALRWWKQEVVQWAVANRTFLLESTHDPVHHRWWFTHRNARKTLRLLTVATRECFTFFNYPLMPKTTNGVEGLFTNVRIKWQIHKGLKRSRWKPFLLWFVYFRNRYYLSQMNILKD